MQVLDIVHRAITKSGVNSSFNPDEVPGEYEAAGRMILEKDVIVGINCDRTLDVTKTAITLNCENSMIKLATIPTNSNVKVIGECAYTSKLLAEGDQTSTPVSVQTAMLQNTFGISGESTYPKDDLGEDLTIGVWTSDGKLFVFRGYPSDSNVGKVDTSVNIKFPPMDVIAVYEESDRREYTFVYRDEFESSEFYRREDVYTLELYEDSLVILFHNKSNTPKRVVLPVPLCIENVVEFNNPNDGIIHAPAKFEQYLVLQTAAGLAQMYGMSTLAVVTGLASQAYNRLLKNTPKRHGQNIRKEIRETIRGYGRDFR